MIRPLSLVLVCSASAALAQTPPASDPVADRQQAIAEAANMLGKANAARLKGNKNFAEQLFSSAEIILGPEALAEIAPLFREGAPPRVTTPPKQLPKDSPPQPAVGGGSEDEEKQEEPPKRGSLSGTLTLGGKALTGRGVVTLEPIGVKWHPRAPRDRVMEQRNREFAPKVMIVRLGSKVSFPNFDNVYHNVFSRSDAKAFDLGLYKGGQAREMTFDKEGIVRLGCNLHANMSAYIVVVNAPHYAVTDESGHFRFKTLQPGKYKLRAWGEKSQQPATQEITIEAKDNTAQVAVSADAPSTDKFGAARGK